MGRKNAARRKYKKNIQEDGKSSIQEKKPSNVPDGFPTSESLKTSCQGKSPKTQMGESSCSRVNSSSNHNPTSQSSPESKTFCPDTVKHSNNQDSNSVIAADRACVVDGGAEMEDNDIYYKVERKTETPESKRRSIKVSLSEVKLFAKNVPLKAVQSPTGDDQDCKSALKNTRNEAKDKPKTEIHAKLQDPKKTDDEPKATVGRIGDKIRLFEHQAVGGKKQAYRSTRSADVSPVRKTSERLKKDCVLSDQRSRSAERCSTATSRFPSTVSDKPMSINERAKNFSEAPVTKVKALPQKPAMTEISQKSTSSVTVNASKSTEPDSQDKLDTKGQLETPRTSDITLKPDGRDIAAAGVISIPNEQPTDSEVRHTNTASNTEETASFSKHVTEKVSPSVGEVEVLLPDKKGVSDDKRQVFKKDLEALDKQEKQLCSSSKKENIDKLLNGQEGSPEPSVNKDEPDTAACSGGTKKPIDKVILPQKEEKAGGNSLSFTSEDSRETSASSHSEAAVCTVTQANKAVNKKTKSDRGPSKGQKATNVPELATGSPGPVAETVVAAKPQSNSVSVEKTENSADDSHTHGADDAEFSNSMPITKASTAKKVTVKVANDTPVPSTAQKDNMAEKGSSVGEPTPVSVAKSAISDGNKRSDDKSVTSISADEMKPTPSHAQCEESKNTASISDIASSLKDTDKILQSPPDGAPSSATVHVLEKTAEKIFDSPVTELSPAANGGISPQADNKSNPTLKVSPSSKANKQIQDSIQNLSMKKLSLPRGLREDSATWQDAPSSWLDVDFPKRKLEVPKPTLTSSGSESNLLDTSGELDDDEFVEKIKNLCSPFSLPPRKHNDTRQPKPTFVMPAIKEDRFEKTFDQEEFKFGLRKNNNFALDTGNLFEKLHNSEAKAGQRPVRASLADRSILLSSLDSNSRLKEKNPVKNEETVKEEKDDHIKVKSRLEGSCVFSSLTSSNVRGKRNGVQTEGTKSGDVPPSEGPLLSPPVLPQSPLPSPTGTSPLKNTLSKQSLALSDREEARAVKAVVSDSRPPPPCFENIKLPDYLQKYLPQPAQSIQGQEQVKTEVNGIMTSPVPAVEADLLVKPGLALCDAVPSSLPGISPTTDKTLPETKQPPAQRIRSKDTRTAKGFCKRPGKMVLFEKPQFCGQAYDIFRDVADATSLQLSPLVSVKVIRGCWIIYEKPDFQGRSIALEEGGIELTNEWAESGPETEPHSNPPMLIGSIRLAVCDYIIPHIDLFTEPEGHGRVTPYHDDVIETGSFGIPLSTASIVVHSGVWLVFSDPGFEGTLAVLEAGQYPFPETWGFPSPFIGSLRPLKMGGYKVENPSEVKAAVYEKPGFEGSCLEIDSDVFSFRESEGDLAAEGDSRDSKKLNRVGSLKITGGLWVGYSQPGFEGQQHILEEGEYLDCNDWGGSEQLLSLRPILSDFASPHLKMFTDKNFGQLGDNIDVTVPVVNMDDTGYGMKTQSFDVVSGVWVVYEEPGFCGESYILEKGLYGSPEDWGALRPRIASAMPVVLDDIESAAKFKVQLYSDPDFQGSVITLEDGVTSVEEGFTVASCKVLAGSWLAFEGQDYTGSMYVLEMGNYPDLRAMGCVNSSSSILSLQPAGFEFSLPSITLFERCGLRGKRVVFTDGSVNLQLAAGCGRVQSVFVEGGMWVLYEGINYRGAQILLKPGEVPDWHQISSWKKIGSLRPLLQKQVNIRLRNRQTGLMMSVTGDLENIKLLRIQVMEETDDFDQMWFYQDGRLRCKLLEDCLLSPSGSVTIAGSRLGLMPEEDSQAHLWSITPDGFVCYTSTSDLVLDVKGGHNFDKNQVILNTFDPIKLTQKWDVEII
ncbi:hypothetical protein PAMA_006838 [Pampus argenteus]